MKPLTPGESERLYQLQKVCLFLLKRCEMVEDDRTKLCQLQKALPEIAATINKLMLFVMVIPTEDEAKEPR
jgi:hypothetical protein